MRSRHLFFPGPAISRKFSTYRVNVSKMAPVASLLSPRSNRSTSVTCGRRVEQTTRDPSYILLFVYSRWQRASRAAIIFRLNLPVGPLFTRQWISVESPERWMNRTKRVRNANRIIFDFCNKYNVGNELEVRS